MVGQLHIVYVLKSLSSQKSYVGMTIELDRRLAQHNAGQHSYTKRHLPWEIVYTETFKTLIEARAREKYLKSASGRRFLKKKVFSS